MAKNYTDDEMVEWLDNNKDQIAAFRSLASEFKDMSAQEIIDYRDTLKIRSDAAIKQWKTWEQTSTSIITLESEKTRHYTNLISVAGYAGFFWIWDKITPLMPLTAKLWTGGLLSLSLAFFVFSEVHLMWATSLGYLKLVERPEEPLDLKGEIAHYNKVKEWFRKRFILIGPIHFWLPLGFGVIGIIFLLWFLVLALINGQFIAK
jgi:hypothetical protein